MRHHHRRNQEKTAPRQLSSRAIGWLIGIPASLLLMLLENPEAMFERPDLIPFGVVLFGGFIAIIVSTFLSSWRGELPNDPDDTWEDLLGKPKSNHD